MRGFFRIRLHIEIHSLYWSTKHLVRKWYYLRVFILNSPALDFHFLISLKGVIISKFNWLFTTLFFCRQTCKKIVFIHNYSNWYSRGRFFFSCQLFTFPSINLNWNWRLVLHCAKITRPRSVMYYMLAASVKIY